MSVLERRALTGRYARREPLSPGHVAPLIQISADISLWRFMNFADLHRNASGQVAGSTSLYEIQLPHRRAELGRTWLRVPYQRMGLNTESQLLLLTYAFETLQLRRVQLTSKASCGIRDARRWRGHGYCRRNKEYWAARR